MRLFGKGHPGTGLRMCGQSVALGVWIESVVWVVYMATAVQPSTDIAGCGI